MFDGIYKIESSDKKWSAEISALLGANIIRLKYEDNDVLVPLKSMKQIKENPFIIGSPILFPANRTYKGEFEFGGEKYNLPLNDSLGIANLHGSLYCQEFTVKDISPNIMVLYYDNIGEIYPFDFRITVEYSLQGNGINQCYTIKNTGKIDMPFTFALHTTFTQPEYFSVPISMAQERDKNNIPTGKYIELNDHEKSYIVGSKSKNLTISGYYKSSGNVAFIGNYKYTVSKNFDHWILYNACGKNKLLCIEPQCGAVNGLNMHGGFRILKANSEEEFKTKIEIENVNEAIK